MQLLNQRRLKLCTVDSVITLRRRYESRTLRMLKALVDTGLGLHWEWHCQDSRLPTYVEEMEQFQGTEGQRCDSLPSNGFCGSAA